MKRKQINYTVSFKDSNGNSITEAEARKRMQQIYEQHYKPVKTKAS